MRNLFNESTFFIENLRSLEFYFIPLLIDEDLELSMKKFLK